MRRVNTTVCRVRARSLLLALTSSRAWRSSLMLRSPSNTTSDDVIPAFIDCVEELPPIDVVLARPRLCAVLVFKESDGSSALCRPPTTALLDATAFSDCRTETFCRSAIATADCKSMGFVVAVAALGVTTVDCARAGRASSEPTSVAAAISARSDVRGTTYAFMVGLSVVRSRATRSAGPEWDRAPPLCGRDRIRRRFQPPPRSQRRETPPTPASRCSNP